MIIVGQRVTLIPSVFQWIQNRSGVVTSLSPSGFWVQVRLDGNPDDSVFKTEYLIGPGGAACLPDQPIKSYTGKE
jgi:hypothetical protein